MLSGLCSLVFYSQSQLAMCFMQVSHNNLKILGEDGRFHTACVSVLLTSSPSPSCGVKHQASLDRFSDSFFGMENGVYLKILEVLLESDKLKSTYHFNRSVNIHTYYLHTF